MSDDIRPKGAVQVQCSTIGCAWEFWLDALDKSLPNGPFTCPVCKGEAGGPPIPKSGSMDFDQSKPRPAVGDHVRRNYGKGNVGTWDTPGQVLGLLDDGKCIVVKRGIQYQVIHWIDWCTMPYEFVPSPRTVAVG